MRQNPRRVRIAFTLVELLVVVGLITVLLAILLPALNGVRKRAQSVKCMANLRTLGQALTMYAQETRYYPRTMREQDMSAPIVWAPCLRLYLHGERQTFHCPARDERSEWTDAPLFAVGPADAAMTGSGYRVGEMMLGMGRTPFSYAYNGVGTGVAADGPSSALGYVKENKATVVRVPTEMIAIADVDTTGNEDFCLFPGFNAPYGRVGVVHFGGANVLFCDGHVQWSLAKDVELFSNDWSDPVVAARLKLWRADHFGQ